MNLLIVDLHTTLSWLDHSLAIKPQRLRCENLDHNDHPIWLSKLNLESHRESTVQGLLAWCNEFHAEVAVDREEDLVVDVEALVLALDHMVKGQADTAMMDMVVHEHPQDEQSLVDN